MPYVPFFVVCQWWVNDTHHFIFAKKHVEKLTFHKKSA